MRHFSLRSIFSLIAAGAVVSFGYWALRPAGQLSDAPLQVDASASAVPSKPSNTSGNAPVVQQSLTPPPAVGAAKQGMTAQEADWTAKAQPTERTSLLLLDLSKVPTESDLRMAGQLGEELIPTRPANPADIADATARAKQERDNLSFGKAIQDWNLHDYDKAFNLFLAHLSSFPDSPWAAEAELHLGCFCQYQGQYDDSQKWFEASQARSPTGHSMNAKATLRLGALAIDQGKLTTATEHFASLRAASDTPSHGTYASYWITRLSLMKQKQTAMRDCAQKSLAEVCAVLGQPETAEKLRALENTQPNGFSLQDIEDLAAGNGVTAQTVLTTTDHLTDLPLPFIAHYGKEEHFVTVLEKPHDGKIRLYDSRVGGALDADYNYFKRQWSGYSVIFSKLPDNPEVLLASEQGKRAAFGGCCGEPKHPDDLQCSKGSDSGCSSCGMPEWNVNPVNMNLSITDTPMWWDAPFGPNVRLTLTYNSLDSLVSIRPFGDKWTFAYSAFAMQDPSGAVILMYGNGYTEKYARVTAFKAANPYTVGTFTSEARNSTSVLRQTGAYTFEMTEGGGTKYVFSVPTTMQGASAASLLTSITDKFGSAVTVNHNPQGAVVSVSHSAGGTWSLIYGANGKVSTMTDPFGRQATFTYTEVNGQQRLTGQTDMGGVAYGYGYTTAARVRERDPLHPNFGHTEAFVTRTNELFINTLNLPTGTWQFLTEPADGIQIGSDTYPVPGGNTWETYRITITDPLGLKEEYFYAALYRGWHRDKKHYVAGVPAYGTASWQPSLIATRYFYSTAGGRGEITSTQIQGGGTSSTGFDSTGQPTQSTAADGRITKYTYNSKNNVLTQQEGADNDPNKIVYTNVYAANGLDVVSTSKKIGSGPTVQESSTVYNAARDVTSRTDFTVLGNQTFAHTTTYTYNARGQITETTDARGAVTRNTFLANGRLEKVESKFPGGTAFKVQALYTYDDMGRVIAQQDADGILLFHEYDPLNRRLKTTFPDNTYTQDTYSCCTLTSSRGRDGSITQYTYDALKRVTQVVKPGGETVSYVYDPNGNVTLLTFGRGETVAWEYDDGNRVTAKVYPDGKRLTFSYDRPNGGRLQWSKDASNRQTTYAYDSYGRVQSVTHPTLPTQSYTYDAEGRTLTWTDGTAPNARVTTYGYDAGGSLQTVDGPLADDTLSYVRDQWGRVTSWSYAGGTESYTFDPLDRLTQITNPLGSFTQSYEGDTGITTEVQYPLAGMKTTYQRTAAAQERQLTAIIHSAPTAGGGGELARYDYTYTASEQIATWRQKQPGMAQREWAIAYDARQQVSAIVEKAVEAPAFSQQQVWSYTYDASGNRTAAQEGSRSGTATYNNLNQLTGLAGGGITWFRGTVSEAANVTISGQNARVYADGTFEALMNLGAGVHDVPLQATDKAGNTTSQTWRVNNGPAGTVVPTHDTEGNVLTDGTRTYTWDAKNRMASVTQAVQPSGTATWAFTYDGGNRRIRETKAGAEVRQWVWNGTSIQEERLVNGTKLRFWTGGFEILDASNQQTGKRLLVTDHLGSTRVVVDGTSGATTASYDYAPWGKRAKISGTEEWSTGYTGHGWHESGLSLAVYRPYDPETGRWLGRDPLGEEGGLNLYGMAGNDSLNRIDVLGLLAYQAQSYVFIKKIGDVRVIDCEKKYCVKEANAYLDECSCRDLAGIKKCISTGINSKARILVSGRVVALGSNATFVIPPIVPTDYTRCNCPGERTKAVGQADFVYPGNSLIDVPAPPSAPVPNPLP